MAEQASRMFVRMFESFCAAPRKGRRMMVEIWGFASALLRRAGAIGSGGFLARHGVDRRGVERLAADRPVALFDLHDAHPGHRAQSLAFDGDHGLGDVRDELP